MDILKSTCLFCRGRERVVVADSVGAIVVGWVVSADDDDGYFQKYFFLKQCKVITLLIIITIF